MSNHYLSRYGDAAYGQGIKKTLEEMARQMKNDFSRGEVGLNYLSKKNDEKTLSISTDFKKIPFISQLVLDIERLISPFYTDLYEQIQKLKAEAKDIEIGDYDKWTNGDAAIYAFDQLTSKSQKKIEAHKEKYVKALAATIKRLESADCISGVMIAGVAYIEFGGDAPAQDYVARSTRYLTAGGPSGFWKVISIKPRGKNINIVGLPERTSFGNISMQLRRVAETLKYYDKLDNELQKSMVSLLEDDRTALILVARHLIDLKNVDFPNKRGLELTLDEMAIVVGRYNVGSNASAETARNCGYAVRFVNNIDRLKQWIT